MLWKCLSTWDKARHDIYMRGGKSLAWCKLKSLLAHHKLYIVIYTRTNTCWENQKKKNAWPAPSILRGGREMNEENKSVGRKSSWISALMLVKGARKVNFTLCSKDIRKPKRQWYVLKEEECQSGDDDVAK